MKATIKEFVERDIEIAFIRLILPVNYEEEQIPNNFPMRIGDTWDATINLDTGSIVGWGTHPACRLHLKVTDGGSYILLDSNLLTIAELDQEYVPHGMIPGSYGDYVDLQISENGIVTNLPKNIDISAFFKLGDHAS